MPLLCLDSDPCDEMLTVRQVTDFFVGQARPGRPVANNMYDRLGAILGIDRHEAKLRFYRDAYGIGKERS